MDMKYPFLAALELAMQNQGTVFHEEGKPDNRMYCEEEILHRKFKQPFIIALMDTKTLWIKEQ